MHFIPPRNQIYNVDNAKGESKSTMSFEIPDNINLAPETLQNSFSQQQRSSTVLLAKPVVGRKLNLILAVL